MNSGNENSSDEHDLYLADALGKPNWAHLCKGKGCDRKDTCRRHLYRLLLPLIDDDALRYRLSGATAANKCGVDGKFLGYIPNDSTEWCPAPSFVLHYAAHNSP